MGKAKQDRKSQHAIQWSINKQNHFAWLMAADNCVVVVAGWSFFSLHK